MRTLSILALAAVFSVFFAFRGTSYKVGEEVADFSLKNIDGKMVAMKDMAKAKGYILVFTCNHCPYSKLYEDRIIALDQKFAKKGYPVIAINPNDESKEPEDSFDEMVKRAKDKGFTFPYLRDDSQEIAKKFGATRTPHVFIVQKVKDKNILKYMGAIDNNAKEPEKVSEKFVEDAVTALLKNKEPKSAETKAVGCGIKWKE
jgi:peroxiredoxin